MFKHSRGKHRQRYTTRMSHRYSVMAMARGWVYEYFSDVLDIRLSY